VTPSPPNSDAQSWTGRFTPFNPSVVKKRPSSAAAITAALMRGSWTSGCVGIPCNRASAQPGCVEPFWTPLRKNIAEIDLAADQHESREAAARKTEEADAVPIDLRRARPSAKHEIDQPLDVGRDAGWEHVRRGEGVQCAAVNALA